MSLPIPRPAWLPIVASIGGTLVAMVILTLTLASADARYALSSEAEHAIGHAVLALPLLALIGASLWLWPTPRPLPGAIRGRRVIIGGLTIVCAGQMLEASGAFAFNGNERVQPTLAILHDLGVVGGPLGLLIIGCGIAMAVRPPTAGLGALDLVIGALAVVGVASIFVGLTPVVGVLAIFSALALVIVRKRAQPRA